MNRREFITPLGVSAAVSLVCSAVGALAQPRRRKRVVGLWLPVGADSPVSRHRWNAIVGELERRGWIEGDNMTFAVKYAVGDPDQFPAMIADFVHMNVDVIVVLSVGQASLAHEATRTIPIVVVAGGDLEGSGLIESLRRPGGNVTGIQVLSPDLTSKRVDLLKQLIPSLTRLAVIVPITRAAFVTPRYLERITEAAGAMRIAVLPAEVRSPQEFAPTIAALAQQTQAALLIGSPFAGEYAKLIADAAAQSRLPIMYDGRFYTLVGGLMSYGADAIELYREAMGFVDKLLRGADPAELPVQQPTKFEFVINLKAAKMLGLEVPATILALADEVIE
jgi:putative tryptophan/tyrosine transport system substrate-binding protein